jgi:hypothetical protein
MQINKVLNPLCRAPSKKVMAQSNAMHCLKDLKAQDKVTVRAEECIL